MFVRGQHVSNVTEIENEYLKNLFEQQGFNYERLSTVYESRAAYNIWAFSEINKKINAEKENRLSVIHQELF